MPTRGVSVAYSRGKNRQASGGIPGVFVKDGDQRLALAPIQSTRQQKSGGKREKALEQRPKKINI